MSAFFSMLTAAISWAFFPATLYAAPVRPTTSQVSAFPVSPATIVRAETAAPSLISKTETPPVATAVVPTVPFFSQFTNITLPAWQKVGCGITDLTMLIHYYRPDVSVTVNQMLAKGISAKAYDYNAGWVYQGLINLSHEYGLDGKFYDLSKYDTETAFSKFQGYLQDGPVILSVHYQFNPKSTIPHLVVVNGIKDGMVYYNDPATTKGTKEISVTDFLKGWKRKVIIIRPSVQSRTVVLNS